MRATYRDVIGRLDEVQHHAFNSLIACQEDDAFHHVALIIPGTQARVRAACAGALDTTAGEWPFGETWEPVLRNEAEAIAAGARLCPKCNDQFGVVTGTASFCRECGRLKDNDATVCPLWLGVLDGVLQVRAPRRR